MEQVHESSYSLQVLVRGSQDESLSYSMSQYAEVNNRQSEFSTKGRDKEGTMVGEKDNEKQKVVRSYVRVMTSPPL